MLKAEFDTLSQVSCQKSPQTWKSDTQYKCAHALFQTPAVSAFEYVF